MRNLAKPDLPPRRQVFFVMVAVDEERYSSDCSRALSVLKRAGYVARPLTHETLDVLTEDRTLVPQFQEIGEPYDPPPAS